MALMSKKRSIIKKMVNFRIPIIVRMFNIDNVKIYHNDRYENFG